MNGGKNERKEVPYSEWDKQQIKKYKHTHKVSVHVFWWKDTFKE